MTDEYISIWEFNRFPVRWLFYIPPLREKIINAEIKRHEHEVKILAETTLDKPAELEGGLLVEAENTGYFAGYREAIEDTVELLRHVYQRNGLYWLLAVVLIPPKNARIIADLYNELEALGFDEYAVKAVFDLLRAWKDRYYKNKAPNDNQEATTTKTESK